MPIISTAQADEYESRIQNGETLSEQEQDEYDEYCAVARYESYTDRYDDMD